LECDEECAEEWDEEEEEWDEEEEEEWDLDLDLDLDEDFDLPDAFFGAAWQPSNSAVALVPKPENSSSEPPGAPASSRRGC
jgi:hypothetical protein